ncbi:MAG: hypothetical protein CVV52_13370 [Spirochaetae bacterium HGW-Spirochaetae-8]|nr:MAG: hypothetical protein CVV52_13370 [Spirochaetae bacterium HGW-Spirochaetae-8]
MNFPYMARDVHTEIRYHGAELLHGALTGAMRYPDRSDSSTCKSVKHPVGAFLRSIRQMDSTE